MASESSSIFLETLLPHARSLLAHLIQAIAGAVPRSHLTALSELLHALLMRLPDDAIKQPLKEMFAQPGGWPSERASDEAKRKFERSVLSARTGKQVRMAVTEFAMCCRGLDGSAYGAASAAAF